MATQTDSRKINEVRSRLAQAVMGACTLIATIIVIAAVLVAVRGSINAQNDIVRLVLDVAQTFDGPLSRREGVFDFDGKYGRTLDAVVNWGLAAVVWLGIGRVASRLIQP